MTKRSNILTDDILTDNINSSDRWSDTYIIIPPFHISPCCFSLPPSKRFPNEVASHCATNTTLCPQRTNFISFQTNMLNDIKEHLRGSGDREAKLLKKQSELEEKVIFLSYCINLFCLNCFIILNCHYCVVLCELGVTLYSPKYFRLRFSNDFQQTFSWTVILSRKRKT